MKKLTKLMNYINRRFSIFPHETPKTETKGKIIMSYHERINEIMKVATPLIEDEINERVKEFMGKQSSDNDYIPDPRVQKIIAKTTADKIDDLLTDIRTSLDTEIDLAQEIIEADLEIEIVNDIFPDSDTTPDDDSVWNEAEWEEWDATKEVADEELEEITCQGCGSIETALEGNLDDIPAGTQTFTLDMDWEDIHIKEPTGEKEKI